MDYEELWLLLIGTLFICGMIVGIVMFFVRPIVYEFPNKTSDNLTASIPIQPTISPIVQPTNNPIKEPEPIQETEVKNLVYNATLTPIIIADSPPPSILMSQNVAKKSWDYNQSFKLKYAPYSKEDNCYINSGNGIESYGQCNGEFTLDFSNRGDGIYQIMIYEQNSNNQEGHSKIIDIRWDQTGPDLTISFPEFGKTYYNNQEYIKLDLTNNESDLYDICQYSIDNKKWNSFKACNTTYILNNIYHFNDTDMQSLYVRAYDDLGNMGHQDFKKFYYKD